MRANPLDAQIDFSVYERSVLRHLVSAGAIMISRGYGQKLGLVLCHESKSLSAPIKRRSTARGQSWSDRLDGSYPQ
mgnify:CR=1 FL=1